MSEEEFKAYIESINKKLLPCPFCGSKCEVSESEPSTARFNEGSLHFAVECFDFNCMGVKANVWQMSPEDALAKWNKRITQK